MKFDEAKIDPFIALEIATSTENSPIQSSQSEAARIGSAKVRAMRLCQNANLPGSGFGFGYSDEYYKDFCGPETSIWMCNTILFLLNFLEDSKFGNLWHKGDGRYDRLTGIWRCGAVQISIQELKAALAERITQLGISEALLWEYMAAPKSIAGDHAFYSQDFAIRMNAFLRK